MNIKREAVRGIAWSALQRGGTQVVSFVVFAILSRLLDADAFGLIALATVFIALIQIFLDQGFISAIIQQEKLEEIHLNTAFWSSVAMGGMMTALGMILSTTIAGLYQEPALSPILRVLSISLIILALGSTQRAILTRDLSFSKLAARTLLSEFIGGTVGIIMAFRGFGVWSLVGRNLARDIVGLVVVWGVSEWRPRFRFSLEHFREMFRFGINVVGERILYFTNQNVDKLLVGYFLGATVLGYYSIGIRLVQLMNKLFFETFAFVVFPVFSRIQTEKDRMQSAFTQVAKFSSMITFPAFVGISFLSYEIIMTLFGSKWEPSIPVLRIVSLSGVIYGTVYLIPQILMAVGKPSWRMRIEFVRTLVFITAIMVGIQEGITGVAIGILATDILLVPILIWSINQVLHINMVNYLRLFVPGFIASAILSIVGIAVRNILHKSVSMEATLFLSIVVGVFVYFLSLIIMERSALTQMVGLSRYLIPDKKSDS